MGELVDYTTERLFRIKETKMKKYKTIDFSCADYPNDMKIDVLMSNQIEIGILNGRLKFPLLLHHGISTRK